MSMSMGVRLICDACKASNHDRCAGQVRAFIDPDGPDWYGCECSCARRRRERRDADWKVNEVLTAYKRRYGVEALAALVAEHNGGQGPRA